MAGESANLSSHSCMRGQPYQDNPAVVQDNVTVLLGRLVEEALLEGLLRLDVGVGVLFGRCGCGLARASAFLRRVVLGRRANAYCPSACRGQSEEGCSIWRSVSYGGRSSMFGRAYLANSLEPSSALRMRTALIEKRDIPGAIVSVLLLCKYPRNKTAFWVSLVGCDSMRLIDQPGLAPVTGGRSLARPLVEPLRRNQGPRGGCKT